MNCNAGWYSEFEFNYKSFGLKGDYYLGRKNIEKGEEGDRKINEGLTFMLGDGFYKAGEYGRLDFYVKPFSKKNIYSKLQFSMHLIPGTIDFSQQFVLIITIGKDTNKEIRQN